MKQQLSDYEIFLDNIPIRCDNTSAINLSKNPIQHSRTKHIEIRHHFLRDHVQKRDCVLEFVDTNNQLAYIFTKPLPKETFFAIRRELGENSETHQHQFLLLFHLPGHPPCFPPMISVRGTTLNFVMALFLTLST